MTDGDAIRVKVFRFDPQRDEGPRYDSFELPVEAGRTVLGVLKTIYENYDPSLAFYHSCRIGKCTGCHVKVNGKVRLACTELVEGREVQIDPMPGVLVRDLVVDRTRAGEAAHRTE